jgi:DNA-binding NtrC family response regulator
MVAAWSKLDEVNVLASAADWAWPLAVRDIFQPRGVSLLVAEDACDFVQIIANRRIHATILDIDWGRPSGLTTAKLIRMDYPLLPCLLLSSRVDRDVLDRALQLEVFSVVAKPVNMDLLRDMLNRIFLKRYNSNIFAPLKGT